jgi:short-subunit dehydrogenase
MRDLKGKVAVVTGAGSGIGRALSIQLAQKGCSVAISDINPETLNETAALVRETGAKVSTHVVDVANQAEMRALPEAVMAAHGSVHIVINNAGVAVVKTVEQHTIEDFEWIVGINFWGVVYGSKFFIPYLKQQSEAHIVNLSSVFGFVGLPTQASYNATKFAVRGFSEALFAELDEYNIGVTIVHPAGIQTNIVNSSRLMEPEQRGELAETFEKVGISPERAATKIIRGIEKNQLRVLICKEAYAIDWMKRLFPTLTHKLVLWSIRRRGGVVI